MKYIGCWIEQYFYRYKKISNNDYKCKFYNIIMAIEHINICQKLKNNYDLISELLNEIRILNVLILIKKQVKYKK